MLPTEFFQVNVSLRHDISQSGAGPLLNKKDEAALSHCIRNHLNWLDDEESPMQ